ncbi:hypothetical protein AWB79_06225 [Caballeronia hypogeia]|uniref:Uncharacterized protein n=1 Tax=Caballeronia hypogeia TaxID=1777140 RepID=A0A158CZH2_9BURK|nr:hypothetical protein AWB79_06225 [Caballeronia hypogeia]
MVKSNLIAKRKDAGALCQQKSIHLYPGMT